MEDVRALVFSAGGMFCAYQAGVWQALEERGWHPDIVAGVSAGALNATAVARGCPAGRLQEWWLDLRQSLFRWNWPPRGWCLLDRRGVRERIQELERDLPPGLEQPRRLLVTLAELPHTRMKVIEGREVTAPRLLASCAIPFLFGPVRVEVEGRRIWAVDGGAFERLPLAVAVQAGASEIISVDVLAVPPSRLWRRFMDQAIRLRRTLAPGVAEFASLPPGVQLLRLDPQQVLGAPQDMLRWSRDNVGYWMEAGYREALGRLNPINPAQPASPKSDRAAPR
jgi:predicted acylesterase/phospholipase RssA